MSTEWQLQAAAWLRAKAAEQERTNREFPKHVEAYPSWSDRPRQYRWLAEDLEREVARPGITIDLREALLVATHHIDMHALRVSHCNDANRILDALDVTGGRR